MKTSTKIMVLLTLAAVCLALVLQVRVLRVKSGSMSPTLETGDWIVTMRAQSYGPGDVITFRNGTGTTTHRIVGEDGNGFITQGDANNRPDLWYLQSADILGRVVWRVPA